MNTKIRPILPQDKPCVLEMMRMFYSSPAVFTNGSDEIFEFDIDACIGENPFLEGYIIEGDDDVFGYAMIAKSFSTEFGKSCIWIEDLYLKDKYRGLGIGKTFFDVLLQTHKNCIFRLEVEEENERAIKLYNKCGFSVLPYIEMKK